MIRVRVDHAVFTVKSVEGRFDAKQIVLKDRVSDNHYTFTANLTSPEMVEKLLNQACEHGFIDFATVPLVGKIECKIG